MALEAKVCLFNGTKWATDSFPIEDGVQAGLTVGDAGELYIKREDKRYPVICLARDQWRWFRVADSKYPENPISRELTI